MLFLDRVVKLCLVFERDEVVVVRCVSGSEMGRFWGRGSCEPDTNFKVNGYFDVEVGEMGEVRGLYPHYYSKIGCRRE